LEKDYLTVPADELNSLSALLTMVGGRIVYAAEPFASLRPGWAK
jgi:predicted amidohydrolase YtcJ